MGVSMSLRGIIAISAVALASCAVGPNFHRPAPPQDANYGSAPAQGATASAPGNGGNAQQFIGDMDIPGQWWELFQSPKLSALVQQALKGNPLSEWPTSWEQLPPEYTADQKARLEKYDAQSGQNLW